MNESVKFFILDLLESEGIDAEYEDKEDEKHQPEKIIWKSSFEETFSINATDIAIAKKKIAWFQTNYHNKSLVRIFDLNHDMSSLHHSDFNYNLNWIPKSNHLDWGIIPIKIQFIGDYLIFVYKEKHHHYLSLTHGVQISTAVINPDRIALINDILLFEPYSYEVNRKDRITRLNILDLTELSDISNEEASSLGIEFKSIHQIGFENSSLNT